MNDTPAQTAIVTHCRHPLCRKPVTGVNAKYCSTSCRVGDHQHHRKNVEAMKRLLCSLHTYHFGFLAEDDAIKLYRLSRGLDEGADTYGRHPNA